MGVANSGALPVKFNIFDSGVGTIVLFARSSLLSRIDVFEAGVESARAWITRRFPEAKESPDLFREARLLLRRYFEGETIGFNAIPVDLDGLGIFTGKVLTETRKVPYGKCASYGAIARRLGCAAAARAVGEALHRNPVPIVIPCHRVVNNDGSLGGFGMGLDMKIRLLAGEGISVPELRTAVMLS